MATRIRLCGPLEIEIDGRDTARELPGGQARSLLCHLLASRDLTARREELTDVLWPERPPADPPAALRPLLSRLRKAIAPAQLDGRERLRLVLPEPVSIDVEEAGRAVHEARAAARGADWATVAERARVAVELLAPGFLPEDDGPWAAHRRREIEEVELEALEWLARSGLARRGAELITAERAGRELIARSPYRETGYRFAMEALAAGGNVAEALRLYEQLRVLLRDELGVAPAAELQALHGRLLTGERVAAPATVAGVPLPRALSPTERSEFVGRERELAALRAAWERIGGGGRHLVLLAGEPGIGKTRLMSEFARTAHDGGAVLYAACQEDALVSYQPFVEALRDFASSAAFDWEAVGPGAGELGRLVPELADRLPVPAAAPDPETRRYLMFEAVSAALGHASSSAPLALVLDDLHWADRATLHLLKHLLRSSADGSLLVVGGYRAGDVTPGHPLADLMADLRRDRLVERIALGGLDEDDVGALIASHAGHAAPSGVIEIVHEETAGNPFFVEEVMRHLIETGVLFERGGRWASAMTADEIGVPDSVKEVISRRLGRLSEACRAVLAAAAVLGRAFAFDVVRRMSDVGDEPVIAGLEEALAAQLIVERGDEHTFTHALVRETLYGQLSAPRRQRMHARAAAAIEEASGDRHVAALAVHHRLAGPAGDAGKAVEYSLRAGAQAVEVSAWEEAAAHWDGALTAMARAGGREPEQARLLFALADLMVVTGDLGRQIAYLEQALALHEAGRDAERAAQAHSRLGMAHSLIDSIYAEHLDITRAFEHYAAARRVLDEGPPRKARGHLETCVATAFTYALDIPRGLEAAARAMDIAEAVGDDVLWASGAQAYAWHSFVGGEIARGVEMIERAFAVADREQRPFLAFMGANIRGQLTWGLGAPDEARAAFERVPALPYAGRTAYRQQIADGIGRCHASAGELAEARRLAADAKPTWITHSLKPLLDLWDGRWDEVEALAERVLATSRRTGNRWDEWAAEHLAARVRRLEGDLGGAAERLERALPIVVGGGAPYFELWVRPDLARVCAEAGRVAEAREHADRARAIAASGEDWRGRAGHADLADAVVCAAEGRPDDAAARFAAARETFARHRLRGEEADALRAWGGALGEVDKLDAAREIYRRHGAGEVWLERVPARP